MAFPESYKLVGVTRSGRFVERPRNFRKAPTDAVMISWGRDNDCAFVGRFYPMRKGWSGLDIRKAYRVETSGRRDWWRGHARVLRVWTTQDAMLMTVNALLSKT